MVGFQEFPGDDGDLFSRPPSDFSAPCVSLGCHKGLTPLASAPEACTAPAEWQQWPAFPFSPFKLDNGTSEASLRSKQSPGKVDRRELDDGKQEDPMSETSTKPSVSRREFLKSTMAAGAVTAGGLSLARSAHAAGKQEIRIGMIGCGGRCSGAAAHALSVGKDVKLAAMTDVFEARMRAKQKWFKA